MAFYFIVILLLYFLINFYIGFNGWIWLKSTPMAKYKKTYIMIISLLSISFIIGNFTNFNFLTWLGSYWLAIFGYSLVLLPVVNLLTFLLKKKGIFWIGIGVISCYVLIIIYGSFNAWSPVIREYSIQIPKYTVQSDLKILMAADLHLGEIVGKTHLQRLVDEVEDVKPDIVLLPGDIINDYIEPYMEENMGDIMEQIDAPLGVYAVMGNHEYYGGQLSIIEEQLENNGIEVLMDESVLINGQFYITGRRDHTEEEERAKVKELMANVDLAKPVIMLDHQPTELGEAEQNGVDLILSGHTHQGQVFPGSLLTDRIFENDWGHLQRGDFHSIVTSGFGLWGPPLRIGTRSEVVVINVEFAGKQ